LGFKKTTNYLVTAWGGKGKVICAAANCSWLWLAACQQWD